MNRFFVPVVAAALFLSAAPAGARMTANGNSLNGMTVNGLTQNGLATNGINPNGVARVGIAGDDARIDGIILRQAR